jgi:hypothetical protein
MTVIIHYVNKEVDDPFGRLGSLKTMSGLMQAPRERTTNKDGANEGANDEDSGAHVVDMEEDGEGEEENVSSFLLLLLLLLLCCSLMQTIELSSLLFLKFRRMKRMKDYI